MAKFIVFSDLHSHNYKQFNDNDQRLTNCCNVVRDAFSLAREEAAQFILFPGDWFDQHKAVPTLVELENIKLLQELFEENPDISIIAISGNHDHASKNLLNKPAVSALAHLAEIFDNFILIDNGYLEVIPENPSECAVIGIPYYEYKEDFEAKLNMLGEKIKSTVYQKRILMIHQTPEGISNTNFPADTSPNNPIYKEFDLVLCGHIHKHEKLTDNFIVVGSPLHRDLGDIDQDKGFLILDTNDLSNYTFVSLNHKYPVFKRVDNLDDIDENENVFAVKRQVVIETDNATLLDTTKFNTNLTSKELVINYFNEVDGNNDDLLAMGLSFLKL